jgi:hypothetical protein
MIYATRDTVQKGKERIEERRKASKSVCVGIKILSPTLNLKSWLGQPFTTPTFFQH